MLKNTIACIVLILLFTVSLSGAEEKYDIKRSAVWVEGGAYPGKSGSSVAVGVRIGVLGIKYGVGGPRDYRSKEVYDAFPVDPAEVGVSSREIGRRTIDDAYGFDMMGFFDVSHNLSLYGEAGPYWQEKRYVRVVTGMSQAIRGWSEGTLFNTEPKHQEFQPAGGAGIQYRFFDHPGISLMFTAGYHTIRGISAGFGFAY